MAEAGALSRVPTSPAIDAAIGPSETRPANRVCIRWERQDPG